MMNLLKSLVAGLIGSLAFEPFAIWAFAIISLGLWYQLISKQHFKQRLQTSYSFGLGVLLPTQMWTGIYVGNLPWLILCVAQACFFMIPAIFVGKAKKFNQIAFICSYVIMELTLRTLPLTGFGWSRLAFSQVDSPLSSIYPLLGVAAVGVFLAWVATVRNLKTFLYPALIILCASFIPNPVSIDGSVRIALVQGGVVNLGLDFNDKPKEVFLRHLNQTQNSILPNQVDLIVWPENAVDVDLSLIHI